MNAGGPGDKQERRSSNAQRSAQYRQHADSSANRTYSLRPPTRRRLADAIADGRTVHRLDRKDREPHECRARYGKLRTECCTATLISSSFTCTPKGADAKSTDGTPTCSFDETSVLYGLLSLGDEKRILRTVRSL